MCSDVVIFPGHSVVLFWDLCFIPVLLMSWPRLCMESLPRDPTDVHGYPFSLSLNKNEILFIDICQEQRIENFNFKRNLEAWPNLSRFLWDHQRICLHKYILLPNFVSFLQRKYGLQMKKWPWRRSSCSFLTLKKNPKNNGKIWLHFQEWLNSHSHTHPCSAFLSHLHFVLLHSKISEKIGHFECKSVRPGVKAVLLKSGNQDLILSAKKS